MSTDTSAHATTGGLRSVPAVSTLLAVLLLLPAGGAAAQEDGDGGARQAVNDLREGYIQAFNQADAERAVSLFTEEGALLPPYATGRTGHEAIRDRLEAVFEAQDLSMQTLPEETWVMGDRAVDRGLLFLQVEAKGEDGEEGASGGDTGKYALGARKVGGAWKIAWFIWNQDHPPGGGGEDD